MKISPGGEREGAFLLLGTPHIVSDLKKATCLKTQDAWRSMVGKLWLPLCSSSFPAGCSIADCSIFEYTHAEG